MKARKLRRILNDTNYIISNHEKYIAIGSTLCHDLIKVDKETLKVNYALDTFGEGRNCLLNKNSKELLFIWDELHKLIKSGEIKDIIDGKDIIKNPLPVFTVKNGVVVESVTDEYGWPNTDYNGICMYENTHFLTKEQAIEYGIKEYQAGVKIIIERIKDIEKDLLEARERLDTYNKRVEYLQGLL